MPAPRTSRQVEAWLSQSLGATPRRQTRHGRLFTRTCPWCGQRLRILVPRDKDPISDGTLASIYRQAHVAPSGLAKCPHTPAHNQR
jgi:hypothetical protein